ncbi:HAD-IIB family hydrolase [Donghicola mangrovi]|uniref:HAD-IIB family hydrolase n=1 Tax=Donghicola mangrovi TaxID=2729614 RepID=A0A850QDQ3_9RHOB|nr:HAD-IIB family hydrolase [Donghicola mangrovi]NVO25078.1 HAD-IIB family hydrolase [Donghicola mangrovi]
MKTPPLIVFTDLDGTLLDHATYDWSPAAPVLQDLIQNDIPVILTSSKTAPEIADLRSAMGLDAYPAICENGAGVMPAGQGAMPERDAYWRLREALDSLPTALRAPYRGFGDMDVEHVASSTGLPLEDAAKAATRAFSEPGLWSGDDQGRADFIAAMAERGVHARDGGRFLTLGWGRRKSDAMAEVLAQYGNPPSIALGDAPNDIEMIEAATQGVIIPNPHRDPLPPLKGEGDGHILREQMPAPNGWANAVSTLMRRYI